MDNSTLPSQATSQSICTFSVHFPAAESSSSQLEDKAQSILALVHSLSSTAGRPYIWHQSQPFSLTLSPLSFAASASQEQKRWLQGKVEVTDCVADEWYIVWLLREISKAYEDAVIQVEDEDGQFLLIEGAEKLPLWVTPTNATNRVHIHRSNLHLIPLSHVSPLPFNSASTAGAFENEEEGYIDLSEAVELVRDPSVDTQAPTELQQIVWERISSYPQEIEQHHHTTLAYLPRDVALALQADPSLVAEGVKAFYEREPAGLKHTNSMVRFPPTAPSASFASSSAESSEPSPVDALPSTVLIPTLLTRPLYSQLILQRFFAPKVFEKVSWSEGAVDSEDERRRSVGMKLACGFEMLYQTSKSQVDRTGSGSTLDGVKSNPAYQTFLKKLAEKDYFGGEVEGSQRWTELETDARQGWLAAREGAEEIRPSFANRVDAAVASALALPSPLAARFTSLPSAVDAVRLESPLDWLTMDEQNLEEMLAARGPSGEGLMPDDLLSDEELPSDSEDEGEKMEGVEDHASKGREGKKGDATAEDRQARRIAKQLEGMAGKVEEFIEGRGGVEGAEFSDEHTDSEESDAEDDPSTYPTLSAEDRAARLEKLVAPLDTAEWGQRTAPPPLSTANPSLHTNAAEGERKAREPKLTSEKYDGASSDGEESDDEVMEGEEGLASEGEGEDGDEAPAVVGGDDIDMGEEMDEFLKFATETLGLTEEQYGRILGERRERGAFVPGPSKPKKVNVVPSASSDTPSASSNAPSAPKPKPQVPNPPLRNPNLTDFDALMEQMDSELAKVRTGASSTKSTPSAAAPKTSAKAKKPATPLSAASSNIVVDSDDSDDDDDDMGAMDEELATLFASVSGQDPTGANGEPMDLNLVKSFLESFQSQGGFGGPAGNLAGRLGFQLPRDA